jgi:hypothetical protein
MAAAEVAIFGMDPLEFLRTTDGLTRGVMQKIAFEARELQRQFDLERANQIAEAVGKKLFGK